MLVPKKYRFIHQVIVVCSHKTQTATRNHPTCGWVPLFLPKHPSPPLAASLPPPSHPLNAQALFTTVSLLRPLYFRWNWPNQEKKKNRFGQGTLCPPQGKAFQSLLPNAERSCRQRMEFGRAPHKGKSAGTEVSGTHHTLASRKPLPKL